MPPPIDFHTFASRRTQAALSAVLAPLRTLEDRSRRFPVRPLGSTWTREHFDGDAYLFDPPPEPPAISLVFVQSRDGNTVVADPAMLGGGPVDFHLIYEGLSRVAADAVLVGAGTVGRKILFSMWHPEIVALRHQLGLPRHPAQVVVSRRGRLNIEGSLLFNVPEVPVFLVIATEGLAPLTGALAARPWITVVPLEKGDLADALRRLRREHGLTRISAIGGRTIATSLIDRNLVQDLWLTTSPREGGGPGTPFYAGVRRPRLELVLRKQGTGEEAITFEQFAFGAS